MPQNLYDYRREWAIHTRRAKDIPALATHPILKYISRAPDF